VLGLRGQKQKSNRMKGLSVTESSSKSALLEYALFERKEKRRREGEGGGGGFRRAGRIIPWRHGF
jgi:hypothetical protein